MKKVLIALLATLFIMTACSVNRHTVGDGPVGSNSNNVKTLDHAKHVYLFFGIVNLGTPTLKHPTTDYQFKASTNILDGIVTSITAGIVTLRTEKILVKN